MLSLRFTDVFAEMYDRIPDEDVAAVDDMLDNLELQHGDPHMRAMIRVGDVSLFATPRIRAQSCLYRITWQYDDRRDPTSILCVTLAGVEVS